MIPLTPEPEELWECISERCHFCDTPTRMWHTGTNNPVCEACAKVHKVAELPNWTKKRRKETPCPK